MPEERGIQIAVRIRPSKKLPKLDDPEYEKKLAASRYVCWLPLTRGNGCGAVVRTPAAVSGGWTVRCLSVGGPTGPTSPPLRE